jgi:hypothetical protein
MGEFVPSSTELLGELLQRHCNRKDTRQEAVAADGPQVRDPKLLIDRHPHERGGDKSEQCLPESTEEVGEETKVRDVVSYQSRRHDECRPANPGACMWLLSPGQSPSRIDEILMHKHTVPCTCTSTKYMYVHPREFQAPSPPWPKIASINVR